MNTWSVALSSLSACPRGLPPDEILRSQPLPRGRRRPPSLTRYMRCTLQVRNEIAVLKKVSKGHRNIVTLHDYFEVRRLASRTIAIAPVMHER